ncbi:hypothetical protein [Actinokineospora enzanensis]|uniref:hypothetical protein n=1 Tax=Actinokineospora enzanensis TaxID=155975 RepID=UPI00037E12A7|nr:hypothetical protein [Actinokineospora enzanensis]
MADDDVKTRVGMLVDKYRRGRSTAEIERLAGMKPGHLAHHLKPSVRFGRSPNLKVIERFAAALGAEMWEVSQAFFADAGVALDGPVLTPEQQQVVDTYALLTPERRRIAIGLLDALLADQAATVECGSPSIAQETSITSDT